jgi:hypothetical protein
MDDEGNEIPGPLLLAALKLIKSGLPMLSAVGASSTDEGWGAVGANMIELECHSWCETCKDPLGRCSYMKNIHGAHVGEGQFKNCRCRQHRTELQEGSKASESAVPEPTQVQLPSGIMSMKHWGDTLLVFGKFKGSGYYEVVSSTEPEAVSYIKWCLDRRVSPSPSVVSPLLKDFAEFIAVDKQLNAAGMIGLCQSMFPGTKQCRAFRIK